MAWLNAPHRVAAELAPAVWTFAAAERRRGTAPRLVAARAIGATGAALVDDIRAFRRAAKLPIDVSVILWPHATDEGVVPIETRGAGPVAVPKARVIRDRVAPLVRAGSLVTEVMLPHECLPALIALRGLTSACVIVAHTAMTCVGVVGDGVVEARYLSSAAPKPSFDSESARLLARYQHIASLAPHIREIGGAAPGLRMIVTGPLPSLRAAMVPLVEELDHEIDVLDGDVPSPAPHALESADPDDISGVQLAWALAATAPGR
ncbi:MAG: hypothetical protein EPO35_07730 [Acidobacteria bacterium]|nr:MAG: hypothetical protein EPO35_07730 [Acidobacteriota bacterium]